MNNITEKRYIGTKKEQYNSIFCVVNIIPDLQCTFVNTALIAGLRNVENLF